MAPYFTKNVENEKSLQRRWTTVVLCKEMSSDVSLAFFFNSTKFSRRIKSKNCKKAMKTADFQTCMTW